MCYDCKARETIPENQHWTVTYWHFAEDAGPNGGYCSDGPHTTNIETAYPALAHMNFAAELLENAGLVTVPVDYDATAIAPNDYDGGFYMHYGVSIYPYPKDEVDENTEVVDMDNNPDVGHRECLFAVHQKCRDMTKFIDAYHDRIAVQEMLAEPEGDVS